jgi:hypothetical protein
VSDFYYVIHTSEDGEPSLEVLSKEELVERLDDDHYGDSLNIQPLIPKRIDLSAHAGTYIIRGQRVVPHAVEKVKRWEV